MEEHINSFFDLIQVDLTEPDVKKDKYFLHVKTRLGSQMV